VGHKTGVILSGAVLQAKRRISGLSGLARQLNCIATNFERCSLALPMEYHMSVRRSIPLSVALFSLLALPVVLVPNSHAQINGVPSSVTSPGFGGRPVNGTPPSVSSVGPRGFTPNSHVTFSTGNGMPPGDGHHHHHHFVQYAPSVVYPVPVPYAVDIGDAEDNSEDDDANYQGGPTIFDRRGSGADSYVPPVKNIRRPPTTETADADDPPAPSAPQVPTLLVFKDGHKLEVGNYAIVGDTLFDLTPGHVRKVALADLDLDATRKTNDDHGITFQLPPSSQAN
jgi:hypothetical protein